MPALALLLGSRQVWRRRGSDRSLNASTPNLFAGPAGQSLAGKRKKGAKKKKCGLPRSSSSVHAGTHGLGRTQQRRKQRHTKKKAKTKMSQQDDLSRVQSRERRADERKTNKTELPIGTAPYRDRTGRRDGRDDTDQAHCSAKQTELAEECRPYRLRPGEGCRTRVPTYSVLCGRVPRWAGCQGRR